MNWQNYAHQILGFEVRKFRVDYAIHEITPISHTWMADGSIYVPSSQWQEAPFKRCLKEGLEKTFRELLEKTGGNDFACYSEHYIPVNKSPERLYAHQVLQEFFADHTEFVGIPIPNPVTKGRNTRKVIKVLEKSHLENYGWTAIHANYVALEGGKDTSKEIFVT